MESESEYESQQVWEDVVPNLPSPMQDEDDEPADEEDEIQEVMERGSFEGTLHRTEVNERLDKIESSVQHLWVHFANSKIHHLSQPLVPRINHMEPDQAAIVWSFPKTALDFYRLQEPEQWPKLKELLLYYNLEDQLTYPADDEHPHQKGAGYGTEDHHEVTYSYTQVQRAIMAYPFDALKVLGAYIGVDAEAVRNLAAQANIQPQEERSKTVDVSSLVHQVSAYNRLADTDLVLQKIARVDWACHTDRFHELIGALGNGQHTDHLARDSPPVVEEDSDGSL